MHQTPMHHPTHSPPIAYPYVPAQRFTQRYADDDAIIRGTLFPELDLPFHHYEIRKPLPCTPMTELMKVDFVCHELRLYLDTHPDDMHAQELHKEYKHKAEAAYKKVFGDGYDWVYDPWPWDGEV
ncbi:MAG: spore coat protein CotJB [Defluviitaleaceae bacterium]|nr:spore coat protein CotJB [Defluviitaleaceae bacterium]